MHMSLTDRDLLSYIKKQLSNFFPDNTPLNQNHIKRAFNIALQRTEVCLSHINFPSYYSNDGIIYFNHLHTDQYATFIYFLSNTLWNEYNDELLASKLMYLNKILHSLNCMYDTQLPEVFAFIHIVGAVIGKAKYGNYLAVYQGVTVGTHDNETPVIGDYVSLLPGSAVVGKCIIGNKVSIGLGTKIYNRNIQDNNIVVTTDNGEVIVKKSKRLYSDKLFVYNK